MGLIPGSGRSPWGGRGNPLQCSCLENPMDRGACWAMIRRVANNRTQLKWLSIDACWKAPHSKISVNWCSISCVLSHVWLCDPMDCSPPSSSIHGIFQARILEWVDISSSRDLLHSGIEPMVSCVSCIGKRILYHWPTKEAHIYTYSQFNLDL